MNTDQPDSDRLPTDAADGSGPDPWGDFLSEASDQLDQLYADLLTTPAGPNDDAAADAALTALPEAVPPGAERVSVVMMEPPRDGPPILPDEDDAPAAVADDVLGAELAGRTPEERVEPASAQRDVPTQMPAGVAASDVTAIATRPAPDPRDLTLADLLARQVPIRWSEAVAVIEELCATLQAEGRSPSIPDARHVRITPAGAVEVIDGGPRDRDLRVLGRLLHALLASGSVPLPLRLFVTSSIASPRFDSIDLYADALSYYAEHGPAERAAVIQALACRALEAPVQPLVRRMPQPPVPVAAAVAVAPRPSRVAYVAVTAAAVVAGAILGAWIGGLGGDTARRPTEMAAAAPRAETAPLEEPAPPAMTSTTGSGVAEDPAPARPSPGETRPRGSSARPVVEPIVRAFSGAALLPPATAAASHAPATRPVSAAQPADDGRLGAAVTRPPAPAEQAAAPQLHTLWADDHTSAVIYSRSDPDVQPPTPLLPRGLELRPLLPENDVRVAVELVVNERGDVESVRYLGASRVLHEMMWLGALKNQKFRPAMKDGSPVAYRLYLN